MTVKHRRPEKGVIPVGQEYVLKWSKKLESFIRYPEVKSHNEMVTHLRGHRN